MKMRLITAILSAIAWAFTSLFMPDEGLEEIEDG